MVGVLLVYPHSPSGAACPWDRVYISVKPLAAMLQPINVCTLYYLSWLAALLLPQGSYIPKVGGCLAEPK